MGCAGCAEIDLGELSAELLEQLRGRRYPLSGSMELTERCNLSCVHCYINRPAGSRAARAREMTSAQIVRTLDQMAEAGCLYLLLTGGEPLLRPDFPELYRHAKRAGMLITLFTNGTLLTDPIADFLAEWPPLGVEITLYGATQQTYERVTRVPGSFARCMAGLQMLAGRGLRLGLKGVLLRENCHELEAMRAFAGGLGLEFRYDGLLWPRLDGGQQPYAHTLSAREVADLDLCDEERMQAWADVYREYGGRTSRADYAFECGAGFRSFHVDCGGRLSLCMMARLPGYDLLHGSFQAGWQSFEPLLGQMRSPEIACRTCTAGVFCPQCPGWSLLVHGDCETPVDRVCELGRLRAAQTRSFLEAASYAGPAPDRAPKHTMVPSDPGLISAGT